MANETRTTLNMLLQLRRDNVFTSTYKLEAGEPGFEISTNTLKIGDGTKTWAELPMANEEAIKALIKAVDDKVKALDDTFATDVEVEEIRKGLDDAKLDKQTYLNYITTHALTDTEINKAISDVNVKFADYRTAADQDEIDNGIKGRLDELEKVDHTHTNKDLLDTYTQTEAALADAVAKKHSHSFVEAELNKIADGDVAKWNTAYEHSQTAHAPANAQENVIESVKVNGTALTITDKAVDITVPTGALAGKDKVAKTDLADALATEIDGKVESVAAGDASITIGGTATAPTVAAKISAAEGNALVLAEDGLKVIIPDSTKVEASETNGNIKVDGAEVTVYTHPDKHTIAEVDGLDTALAGKETAGAAAQALTDAKAYADQAEADAVATAKAYVDEEDKFYNGITTVNALGGIAANTSLDNKTTHEILDMLLFPYVAFSITSSSRNAAAATLENGATQTLSSCSITVAKKSKPITSITLYNGSTVLETKTGDAVANGGTITFNGFDAITVSKSNNPNLKFTVTDGQTSTDRNVGASTFVYPYYWGVCAPDATVDEALVEGLTKSVSSKGNKTDVSFTCANQRQVFAYPKAHGVLKSIIDPNNFEIIGDFTRSELSITGLDGTAQTYYVYVGGACSVSDFKIDFKY